jgi:hypothetical protein
MRLGILVVVLSIIVVSAPVVVSWGLGVSISVSVLAASLGLGVVVSILVSRSILIFLIVDVVRLTWRDGGALFLLETSAGSNFAGVPPVSVPASVPSWAKKAS